MSDTEVFQSLHTLRKLLEKAYPDSAVSIELTTWKYSSGNEKDVVRLYVENKLDRYYGNFVEAHEFCTCAAGVDLDTGVCRDDNIGRQLASAGF